ncbi:MAG TPA: hypothetical protein PLH19_04110 [Anaerolineae bacterium]|nr:hypothetical protein [Anaerolineae bacterium]HQH37705.1 hypothetical protein [Anaerolineae bacterium]
MEDPLDFLLPLFILLIIGIIGVTFWVAWIISKGRSRKQLPASETTSAAASPFDEAPHPVSLVALNHAPDGTWEIAINGQLYPTLEAVPDDNVRQDVVAGLKELAGFARSYVQREQTVKKQSPAEPPPPIEPPAQDKRRVLLKGEPLLRRPEAAPTMMPTLDLVGEIGEIISTLQMEIPSLSQRSIRLQNAPGGGIQFAIDGIVYADVDAIPDADIQALIRAATKEWERR